VLELYVRDGVAVSNLFDRTANLASRPEPLPYLEHMTRRDPNHRLIGIMCDRSTGGKRFLGPNPKFHTQRIALASALWRRILS